ncbi:RNA polymerase sigma-70 factor [Nocardia cyriacigeorgica]|uniref:RNA polymerase sigma-70 factor n=1 Tax=Nocardia cyriacigeorgica TaxID=135487 RepID=UPI00189424D3|nr:RNA polymerase sigma-70 factor [Nocardia cyriacigeorgica]MBF6452945.1 RNA polymerase sigma-70 factor [Nocardia cyriacigeorgica]MBF6482265.1 RNA polymerase sigma-70 factor [Nocardia cyriacigeorgica]MBF6550114.1 RNA polymerase sigma-70 factor [Nocardia cyriacigeorgica]
MDAQGLADFEAERPRLFSLAYRMLSSAAEAEDAVQVTYLRWEAADRGEIRSAQAWLTTVVVNLCRSWLDSARARRERYVGPWLPEPVPTGAGELGPLESAQERELVSLALLTALERLTPVERAVFVLREAFGYSHREIAGMLELTESNAQQIFHRAGRRVRDGKARFDIPAEQARALMERFFAAARNGEIAALEQMLAADVVSVADGNGMVGVARRPVVGASKVAVYLTKLFGWVVPGVTIEIVEVNGLPAVCAWADGAPLAVCTADSDGEVVTALRLVVAPGKLAYFGRTAA